jgi:hypothetical protein
VLVLVLVLEQELQQTPALEQELQLELVEPELRQ